METKYLDRFRELAEAFDTETAKIQPGLLTPELICGSVSSWDFADQRIKGHLLAGGAKYKDVSRNVDDCLATLTRILKDKILVGLNIAYDLAVMVRYAAERKINLLPLVFKAFDEGRVFDVGLAEALHAIANGHHRKDPNTLAPLRDPVSRKLSGYSLPVVYWLNTGNSNAKKNDRYRTSYALLKDTQIELWESEAGLYPVDDANNTLAAALCQTGILPRVAEHEYGKNNCLHCGRAVYDYNKPCVLRPARSDNLHNVAFQTYAAFCLQLGAVWGLTIDLPKVEELESTVRASRQEAVEHFLETGLLKLKKDKGVIKPVKATARIKNLTAAAYGCTVPCPNCNGTGKIPNKKGKLIGDRVCDSSGFDLDKAPVPRTAGSKCRTCKSTRSYVDKTGSVVDCTSCIGLPEIIPGCETSRDALTESGDEELINFASYLEQSKLLETYIPFLKKGINEVSDEETEDDTDDE